MYRRSSYNAPVVLRSFTHPGLRRENNEDRLLMQEYGNGAFLISVADGMGGEAEGALAAEIAIQSLDGFDPNSQSPQEALVVSMRAATRKILERVAKNSDLEGMGTTMTAAFRRGEIAYWAHAGDSRLYLFREKSLKQITEDHTPAGILLKDGKLTREEARAHPLRNVLFECVGCEGLSPDTGSFNVEERDLLLLSTDGLHDQIPEEAIVSILQSDTTLNEKLEGLIQAALESGGRDNITVVAAQL